jgi:hypothetical protein
MGAKVASAKGRYLAANRYHPNDRERIDDAGRELAAAKIEEYVERVVAQAPPLTPEERDRIALALRGGESADVPNKVGPHRKPVRATDFDAAKPLSPVSRVTQ